MSFLSRALLPLHKATCVALYHQQLAYCVIQYVKKDVTTSVEIVRSMVRFWPWSRSSKIVLFLDELEQILELMEPEQIDAVDSILFGCLKRCLACERFQVAERTLFLWQNEHLV